jgi:16S rRNA (cytosine1402-N4)-methyltransferase
MVAEVLEYLAPRKGGRYLDLTVGAGGHARAVAERIGPEGLLVGVDVDEEVLRLTADRLGREHPQTRFLKCNFSKIDELRRVIGPISFQGIIVDLGVSSIQLDSPGRGFSLSSPGLIDMRMDRSGGVTAAQLLREMSQEELERVIREYGEERYARRIARAVVEERKLRPFTLTTQLASLVARVVPRKGGRIHPATRTFQALRIAVNDELGSLSRLLARFHEMLDPGGVAVVISFHSLEDRLVKRAFREGGREGRLEVLTRKPVCASQEEIRRNPRSRSAKLRAARFVGTAEK